MTLANLATQGTTIVRNRAFQWLLVAVVLLLFVYLIYRQGQKSGGFEKAKPLPDGGNGIPAGWSTTKLVDELWDNLDSFYWWKVIDINGDYRGELMTVLLSLSKDQLTAVYNDYNFRYGNKDGKTSLTKKINGEYWLTNKSQVVEKLRNLGLS